MSRQIDYSFKILEEILMFRKYSSRDEVIKVANKMIEVVNHRNDFPQKLKDAYNEALNKLNTLTYDEMNEIIDILSSYDD